MSLSQYVRYKALGEDKVEENQQKTADEFLNKYIAKMSRLIVDGWVHTKAMALNNLSEAQQEDAHQMSLSEFEKMGVSKWEEKYGEKTPKINKEENTMVKNF
jgi:flagellar motor component MotA